VSVRRWKWKRRLTNRRRQGWRLVGFWLSAFLLKIPRLLDVRQLGNCHAWTVRLPTGSRVGVGAGRGAGCVVAGIPRYTCWGRSWLGADWRGTRVTMVGIPWYTCEGRGDGAIADGGGRPKRVKIAAQVAVYGLRNRSRILVSGAVGGTGSVGTARDRRSP
jgi:hypothetical protein